MNIQEEKSYIYGMMRDITTERRKLTDIYFGLKERLDFLNSLEEKGLDELSLKGYADLHNETQKQLAVTNIQRETNNIIEKIESSIIIEEKEKPIIPKAEIQNAIEKENKKGLGNYLSTEKIQSTIISVLKDAGAPLHFKELFNRVNLILDNKIKRSNFQTNIMPRAVKDNERIERPMKGFYQYR